jgi:hypothetical protein
LVADSALPSQDFRQFQSVVSRFHEVLGSSFFVRLSFVRHGSLSGHFFLALAFFSKNSSQTSVSPSEIVFDRRNSSGGDPFGYSTGASGTMS